MALGTDELQLVPETSSDLEKLIHAITLNQIIRRFTTSGISIDHGTMVGLADDDHTQYYNSTRLATVLADYVTDTELTTALSSYVTSASLATTLGGYYTISAADAAFAPLSHTHTASQITDFAEAVDDRVAALFVAGSNITLTYNDGAGTFTIDATGGSLTLDGLTDVATTGAADGDVLTYDSGSGTWGPAAPTGGSGSSGGGVDYDVSPNPNAYDDEFRANTLAGAWTVLGSPTMTNNAVNSCLRLYHAASGTMQLHGIYKTAPSMPFTVTLKIDGRRMSENYQNYGLFVSEASPSTFYTFGPCWQNTNGGDQFTYAKWGSRTSRSSVSEAAKRGFDNTRYIRMIVTSSTSITLQTSVDGLLWQTVTTVDPGLTIGTIGIFGTGHDNSVVLDCYFDWIRFGDTVARPESTLWQHVGGNSGESVGEGRGLLHVDAPPVTPTAYDDEFDATALDSKWTWRNQGTATATLSQGALKLTGAATNSSPVTRGLQIIEQTVSGDFKFRAKLAVTGGTNYNNGGFALVESGTGKCVRFCLNYGFGGAYAAVAIEAYSDVTTYSAQPYLSGSIQNQNPFPGTLWKYFEVERSGSTLYYRLSETGEDGSFTTLYSVAQTTHFTTAPDRVGLYVESISTTQAVLHCDWFRSIGTSYAPGKFIVNGNGTPTTVDTRPTTPNTMDDEFEGTALSSKWTWRNQGTSTATVSDGSLIFQPQIASGENCRILEQTVSGSWKVRAKIRANVYANFNAGGLAVIASGTGKLFTLVTQFDSSALARVVKYTNVTTVSALAYGGTHPIINGWNPVYYEIECNGTTLYFRISADGLVWVTLFSEAASTFLGTPDRVGIVAYSNNGSVAYPLTCEWFRRIS